MEFSTIPIELKTSVRSRFRLRYYCRHYVNQLITMTGIKLVDCSPINSTQIMIGGILSFSSTKAKLRH
ncbi:hypothetical protein CREGCYN_12730 [Synechococcus sp. M16CYN]